MSPVSSKCLSICLAHALQGGILSILDGCDYMESNRNNRQRHGRSHIIIECCPAAPLLSGQDDIAGSIAGRPAGRRRPSAMAEARPGATADPNHWHLAPRSAHVLGPQAHPLVAVAVRLAPPMRMAQTRMVHPPEQRSDRARPSRPKAAPTRQQLAQVLRMPAPAPTRPMPERWRSAPRTATQPNQPARRPKAAPTRQQQLISYHRGHRADRRTSCGRRARTPQARCKHEGPAEISPHARGSHGQLRLASHSL